MGSLTLQGSTSGQITIAPPAVAGTNTLTLPASTGTLVTSGSPTFTGTLTVPTINSGSAVSLALQSNGTTAITIDTSQNVIVGNGATSATPVGGVLEATDGSGTNIAGASLTLQGGRGTGTGAGGALIFQTAAAGSSGSSLNSPSERMRIDASGNVGIGTASPSYRLQISGSFKEVQSAEAATVGNVQGTFASSFQRTSNDTVLNIGYATTPDSWIVSSSYGTTGAYKPLAFATSDTERMRITAAGGVSFGSSGTAYGTSGQYLKSNGDAPPSWASLSASGALIRAPQILTSGTSYTTPSNCTAIYCEMLGGGGGGGGVGSNGRYCGGGGGGGYGFVYITVTASTTYTISIGAGGSGGTSGGGTGGNGGNTSITVGATTYTASGGSGAVGRNNGTDGPGGAGGGTTNLSTLAFTGRTGGSSGYSGSALFPDNYGGIPIGVFYPGGGVGPGSPGSGSGSNASYYGCGGGGAGTPSGTANAGGSGSQGYMRIWEYT